ncbi:hypothetical protein [Novosphingobium naphthalenivorans]|uniref:hypothetical protein n=1 Tax=Novosphingobium naphthalenivorans TaxID=273168 RepID=UPI00082E1B2E|nr:hypothetical protein [Novosphingobium naphthalenivorans]
MREEGAPVEISDEDESRHALKVGGEVARRISRIFSGSLHLAVLPGLQEVDDEDVEILVPILSCELEGKLGVEDQEVTVGATLMFDNVAFLLMRLMSDFEEAMEQLKRLSGDLAPAPERLDLTSQWIEMAGDASQRIQALLAEISSGALEHGSRTEG